MYYNLVSNVLNVLFLCGIVIWISLSLNKKYSHYVLGVMFGLITIFVMHGKITVVEGRFHDFRNIILTMAGFIGGPVTAAIAAIISSLYRYKMGGTGSMGGVIGIIIFACFGTFLGKRVKSKQNGKKIFLWFIIGLIMACISLFVIAFIPPWKVGSVKVLRALFAPYLIIFPLATTIIFNFYFLTYEFFGKATILNTLLNCSPINLMIFDTTGPVLLSKNLINKQQLFSFIKDPHRLLTSNPSELDSTKQQHKEFTTENGRHFVTDLSEFQIPSGESAYVAIVNDVTDRNYERERLRVTTENLIKSQEEMTSILESMTDAFVTFDKNDQILYINHTGEIALGISRDELLGKKLTDVFKVSNIVKQRYHEVVHEKRSITFEIFSVTLGGKWLEISFYPSETGATCYFRDITSRKMAEEKLRQSEEKFSKAFHGGPIMMAVATVDNDELIDANEALCSGTGYTREEIIGYTAKELNFFVDLEMRQNLNKVLLAQGKIENAELDFRTKAGEIRHGLSWSQLFYLDEKPCHITGLIDVTEQKNMQREMARLDRLNLVGQMAAGIGHEIRNPMTTVRGYLQLLGTKPEYAARKSTFDLMISELDRANSIITEFLSLSQIKQTELKLQNLNNILFNLFPLLEADTFTQNKQIHLLPGEIPDLKLNAKEMTQLILNLARNGLEAMEERGCLTLESYLQDDKVILAIEDEGSGIPPKNINKLGIPFFTTKDYGTGLGLATCYKIAESHNATICVDSNPNGTTFYIIFPVPNNKANYRIA